MSTTVAALSDVRRTFRDGKRAREVLSGIELTVNEGEMVALVGPSGCGKTTLLTILGALDIGFSGEVQLLGCAINTLSDDALTTLRNEHIGFVFQSFHLLDHMSVAENVMLPLWLRGNASDTPDPAVIDKVLEQVGLSGRGHEAVPSMSGGERQRVAIARAMITQPKLLLADEPTGNLDVETGNMVFDLFEKIKAESCAVVVATHDLQLAERADRIVRLSDGTVEAA